MCVRKKKKKKKKKLGGPEEANCFVTMLLVQIYRSPDLLPMRRMVPMQAACLRSPFAGLALFTLERCRCLARGALISAALVVVALYGR
jgi:hypothetical protein